MVREKSQLPIGNLKIFKPAPPLTLDPNRAFMTLSYKSEFLLLRAIKLKAELYGRPAPKPVIVWNLVFESILIEKSAPS